MFTAFMNLEGIVSMMYAVLDPSCPREDITLKVFMESGRVLPLPELVQKKERFAASIGSFLSDMWAF
jgi:hypothetical protein